MTERRRQLGEWLGAHAGLDPASLQQVAGDASFRRYYRVSQKEGGTLIVMDAPPEHEDCRPFVDVTARLETAGVHVPHILEQDLEQGFLLLSDLGSRLYLDELNEKTVDRLYGDALGALAA